MYTLSFIKAIAETALNAIPGAKEKVKKTSKTARKVVELSDAAQKAQKDLIAGVLRAAPRGAQYVRKTAEGIPYSLMQEESPAQTRFTPGESGGVLGKAEKFIYGDEPIGSAQESYTRGGGGSKGLGLAGLGMIGASLDLTPMGGAKKPVVSAGKEAAKHADDVLELVTKLQKVLPEEKLDDLSRVAETLLSQRSDKKIVGEKGKEVYTGARNTVRDIEPEHLETEEAANVWKELDNAMPGQRHLAYDEYGSVAGVKGQHSTFPEWIPQGYRTSPLVKKAADGLASGERPSGKAGELFDIAHQRVLDDLGVKKNINELEGVSQPVGKGASEVAGISGKVDDFEVPFGDDFVAGVDDAVNETKSVIGDVKNVLPNKKVKTPAIMSQSSKVVEQMGPGGKELSKRITQSADEAERRAGSALADIDIQRMSKDELTDLKAFVTGEKASVSDKVARVAEKWVKVRDEIAQEADKLGLEIVRKSKVGKKIVTEKVPAFASTGREK